MYFGQFCKLQEQDTLRDLYNQDDDHQELANYYVSASYREKVQLPFLSGHIVEVSKNQ